MFQKIMDLDQTAQSVLGPRCLLLYLIRCNAMQLFAADDFSRRHFQMHFFRGALRVKTGFLALRPIFCFYRCDSQFKSCRHNNTHTLTQTERERKI